MKLFVSQEFKSPSTFLLAILLVSGLAIVGCSSPSTDANNSETTGAADSTPARNSSTQRPSDSTEKVFDKTITSTVEGKISKVLDGDTVMVKTTAGQELTVRMECIDAPEGKQRFASMVLQKVTRMLDGQSAELLITGKDGRGRTLAFVMIDGQT